MAGRRRYRFLVVEDDPLFRAALVRLLSSIEDAIVDDAEDNAEAWRLLGEQSTLPDLITSDLSRPGGSGYDFVSTLRISRDQLQTIPVVVISGSLTDEKELMLYRQGYEGVLRKPIDAEHFYRVINRILRRDGDPDLDLIGAGGEGASLDYKVALDLSDAKMCAAVAKDVIAMANGGGGSIVVGVEDKTWTPIGVPSDSLKTYDPTFVNDKLRKYTGSLAVEVRVIERQGRHFVIMKVPPSLDTIAFAEQDHQGAALYRGRIYMQSEGGISFPVEDGLTVRRLVDRLVERRLRRHVRH